MTEKQQPENTGRQRQQPDAEAQRPRGAATRQVSARPDGTGDVRGVPEDVEEVTQQGSTQQDRPQPKR